MLSISNLYMLIIFCLTIGHMIGHSVSQPIYASAALIQTDMSFTQNFSYSTQVSQIQMQLQYQEWFWVLTTYCDVKDMLVNCHREDPTISEKRYKYCIRHTKNSRGTDKVINILIVVINAHLKFNLLVQQNVIRQPRDIWKMCHKFRAINSYIFHTLTSVAYLRFFMTSSIAPLGLIKFSIFEWIFMTKQPPEGAQATYQQNIQ